MLVLGGGYGLFCLFRGFWDCPNFRRFYTGTGSWWEKGRGADPWKVSWSRAVQLHWPNHHASKIRIN